MPEDARRPDPPALDAAAEQLPSSVFRTLFGGRRAREQQLVAERALQAAERERADAERERADAERERADAERARHAAERERLDAERAALHAERERLHGKIDQLERRLTAKERKLARLQAFDAERRTLEPPPGEDPIEGQLTFDGVSE